MTIDDRVKEWLEYAKGDLSLAEYAFNNMCPKPLPQICFHCQQAAEKYIKGVMVHFNKEVIKTHDLV